MDVIDRVPRLGSRVAWLKQLMADRLVEHRAYIREHGDDMPLVKDWKWPG